MSQLFRTVVFVIAASIFISQPNYTRTQTQSIFRPPKWIQGTWKNMAESNSTEFEMITITKDGIEFVYGFGDQSSHVTLIGKYKGDEIKESFGPNLYRIMFQRGLNQHIYQFRLCDEDMCQSQKSKALIYSVTENNKVTRFERSSINFLFFRKD